MRKALFAAVGAFLVIGSIVLALPLASGGVQASGGDDLLESSVIGIPVGTVTVRGVPGGAFPWVVSKGEAELDSNGKLKVKVKGLLFSAGPFVGTIGPVTHVSASLTCEGDGLAAANSRTTGRVPLSPAGDAKIKGTITLPATCVGPIVLVRVANVNPTTPGAWIAATGF